MADTTKNTNIPAKSIGCGLLVLTVISSIWVIVLSAGDLFLSWVMEQSMFESFLAVQDFRWINHAICSGLILVVCVCLALLIKTPRIKNIFRLWTYAAILAILAIPIKTLFLTAQNETAVFQLGAMIILVTGNLLFKKKTRIQIQNIEGKRAPLPGLAILLGALVCIPWVLWGALGSVLDTILELTVGMMFAWMAVQFTFSYYLEKTQALDRDVKLIDILVDGFVVAVFLLISVAALAHNGSQQMLVLTVPVTGWLITMFSLLGRNDKGHGKLAAWIILFVAMAMPLIFFDMDELAAIFTGGVGETLEWANKAAWFTFLGILTITVALLPNLKSARQVILPKKANIGLMAIASSGILAVYLIWGQVGFYGDTQFVILKEQADLSSIQNIINVTDRRQNVFDALIDTAESSQVDLRAKLDQWHLEYKPYYLLNAIEVKGGALVRYYLNDDPSIDRILDNPQLRPLPKKTVIGEGEFSSIPEDSLWNLTMIRADQVKNELGITGSGIVIGQTDSGVDGHHIELTATYRGANSSDDYNWYDPWNGSPFPTDNGGHGTQTLGVVMGQNTGVAPGAEWIGCVNLDRNLGNPSRYLDCMQFMLAPFPRGGDPFTDGDPARGAMIVNNSWGCPDVEGCDEAVFEYSMEALKTAGIFMSASAGNSGYYGCSTITDPPAIYNDVFTTGSVDINGQLSEFSSIGPVLVTGSGQKPDLVAPGEGILSSFPGGTYSTADGTSFSAPHVTGVVALMWSANPQLIGNIDATAEILRSSAQEYEGNVPECGEASDAVGTGILDAYQAVKAAIEYNGN